MLIKVKTYPSAGKKEVIKKDKNSFEIWIKEKPIQGQANQSLATILSECLNIPRKNIRLIKGFKQRNKTFKIKE